MSDQGFLFTKKETRQDQICKRFIQFHKANPNVWQLFCRFVDMLQSRGINKYSAYAVIERIRWEVLLETKSDDLKINNDFIPYYARLFMWSHPSANGFFKLRKMTSGNKDAYDVDLTHGPIIEAGEEEELKRLLMPLI